MSFLLMLGTLLVGSMAIMGDDGDDAVIETQDDQSEDNADELQAETISMADLIDASEDDTDGDDTVFGGEGAETLEGGAGDDVLYSGSDISFTEEWNHFPGELTRVDGDADVLDGGEGDDELWLGANNVATGGEGADTFHTFTVGYGEEDEAAEITDFNAEEDTLEIDFPVHEGYYTEDFTTQDAIDSLMVDYDEDADTTTIEVDGQNVVTLNGDQTGATIAFYDAETDSDAPVWLDIEGNEMSQEEGEAASIILNARDLQDVIGEIS